MNISCVVYPGISLFTIKYHLSLLLVSIEDFKKPEVSFVAVLFEIVNRNNF